MVKNLTANAGDIRDTGYLILRELRMLDILRNSQSNLFVKKESTGFRGKSTGTGIWKSSSGNSSTWSLLCDPEQASETSLRLCLLLC